jgi:type II secretory pathway pseudopilin PulG
MRTVWRRRHDDRGETLVEVLVSLMILSVAVVALIGGLVTAVVMSDIHRKQAKAGAFVRDFAEKVENAVAATPTAYTDCATTATYKAFYSTTGDSAFLTPDVTEVMYWDESTDSFVSTCSPDSGVQRLSLRIASADGRAAETLDLIIRKPCRSQTDYPADPTCT